MENQVRRNSTQPYSGDTAPNSANGNAVAVPNGAPPPTGAPAATPSSPSSSSALPLPREDAPSMSSSSLGSGSELPAPPDGGWGWVVVFASFMIHIVADGITYTFGIFLPEIMSTFVGSGRGSASLIPSILVGVTLCAGPLASSLTNRYGCRPVTILGSVLAAAGLGASALAPGIPFLYLSVGLCTGLGFGLIYLPAIVSVSMYFEKRRAFATGIAVCGSGLGTFIMAPVTRGLIDALGWPGALAVTGSIVLTCVLFGALFRPLTSDDEDDDDKKSGCDGGEDFDCGRRGDSDEEDDDEVGLLMDDDAIAAEDNSKENSFPKAMPLPPEIQINGEPLKPLSTQFFEQQQQQQQQQQLILQQQQQQQQQHRNGFRLVTGSSGKYSEIARCALSHPVLPTAANGGSLEFGSHSKIFERKRSSHSQSQARHAHHGGGGHAHHRGGHAHHHHGGHAHHHGHHHHRSGIMFRKDILYGGSLQNIPEYKNDPKAYHKQMVRDQLHHPSERKGSCDAAATAAAAPTAEDQQLLSSSAGAVLLKSTNAADSTDSVDGGAAAKTAASDAAAATAVTTTRRPSAAASATSIKKSRFGLTDCCPRRSSVLLRRMLDTSLLRDPVFLMFAASNFLTSIGFNVPYVYTVDRALELEVSKERASALLSVVGVANTLARIALGYLSDKAWINRLYLYNTSLSICGITIALSHFFPSYLGQCAYCAVFGVTSGAYVGLTSVVLVDLLGLDRLTNAFGLLLLFQGIASVIGPPIIGLLYDWTGDYSHGFYFAGTMIFLSGAMLFALPAVMRTKNRKKEEEARANQNQNC